MATSSAEYEGGVPSSLAQSLAILATLRGRRVSEHDVLAAMRAGEGEPSLAEYLAAAAALHLAPALVPQSSVRAIPDETLPCVLLLHEDAAQASRSCVLVRKGPSPEMEERQGRADPALETHTAESASAQAGLTVWILSPETGSAPVPLSLARLEERFAGYVVFMPEHTSPDPRLPAALAAPAAGVGDKKRGRLTWFWSVIRLFLPIYRDVAVASMVINLLSLATPLFFMNVYDRVIPNNAVHTLWALAAGVVLAYIMDFVLRSLRSRFVDLAGRNADVILTSGLMERVLNMRLDNRPESTGAIIGSMAGMEQVREFFGSGALSVVFDVPFILLFVVIILAIGGPMVGLLLLALSLMLLFGLVVHKLYGQAQQRHFDQALRKNSLLTEMVGGLETIKVTSAQGRMRHLWEQSVDRAAHVSGEARGLAALMSSGSLFIGHMVNTLLLIWGVYRINAGSMSQGALIACVILSSRAMAPLTQLAMVLTNMQKTRLSLVALDRLMLLPQEGPESEPASMDRLAPSLKVDKLVFRYPGSPVNALSAINVHIAPGERVAFVGPAGSGKSTLARLLAGLYLPAEGHILYGDVDIRQFTPADLRAHVGFMPQDSVLFYGTLRENIRFGNPGISDEAMFQAARIAGVDEFAKAHPKGYDLPVGEHGSSLSGGQRQMVALARTLARSPQVLILDEPSSNLDMAGEHRLMERLRDTLGQRTLVLMTHRPSLLALVNYIVLMDQGRVVGHGPRDQFLQAMRSREGGMP